LETPGLARASFAICSSAVRFNQAVVDLLDVIESFFGDHVWAHSIVVYNKEQDSPEVIWADESSDPQTNWLTKWKERKTIICTAGEVAKNPEGHPIMDHRTRQAVRALKDAIVSRQGVYDHALFEEARQAKLKLTKEAMALLKTGTRTQDMEKVNNALLDGSMNHKTWKTETTEILASDAEAWETQERARRAQEARKTAEKKAEASRLAREQAEAARKAAQQQAETSRLAKDKAERESAEAKRKQEAEEKVSAMLRKDAEDRRRAIEKNNSERRVLGTLGGAATAALGAIYFATTGGVGAVAAVAGGAAGLGAACATNEDPKK